jgi:hypothetical protein
MPGDLAREPDGDQVSAEDERVDGAVNAADGGARYRMRRDELSWREVDGEIVVLDERPWTYLHLNETGAAIWSCLVASGDGGATVPELAAALLAEFAVDAVVANADASALVEQLLARELIERA